MRKLSLSLVSVATIVGAIGLAACGETAGPIVVGSGGAAPGTGGALPSTGGTDPGSTGGATTDTGGAGATTSSGGDGAGATGTGGGALVEGTPLLFDNGWLEADANTLGVQGAVFAYADTHTIETMVENIKENGPIACISGEAFKVDTMCTVTDPNASDCFGEFWGAAIGFNLNQPKVVDEETGEEIGGDPVAFDASAIKAFSFELTGATIPGSLRFSVDVGPDANGVTQYCTTKSTKVLAGVNTINIDDLRAECWEATAFDMNPHPDPAQIVKIAWGVVTNSSSAVPFDFCVGNVIAVP